MRKYNWFIALGYVAISIAMALPFALLETVRDGYNPSNLWLAWLLCIGVTMIAVQLIVWANMAKAELSEKWKHLNQES